MIINKVIISSDSNEKYISFWPIVKKAWKSIGIEPILIYSDTQKNVICEENNVYFFNTKNVEPGFVARNIRLLFPSFFPDDVCLLSDIDMVPLDIKYFKNKIFDIDEDSFLIFRNNKVTENQIPICWNAAKGKLWGELFQINDFQDIYNTLDKWYKNVKNDDYQNWYNDQIMLKNFLNKYELKNINKVQRLDDFKLNFKRLDRSNFTNTILSILKNETYTDYHMHRQINKNKILNTLVLNYFLYKNRKSFLSKYALILFLIFEKTKLKIKSIYKS